MSSSWFAGATPKLATAVMYNRGVGNEDLEGYLVPFFGGTFPAMTFKAYMDVAINPASCGEFIAPGNITSDKGKVYNPVPSCDRRRASQPTRARRAWTSRTATAAAAAVAVADGDGDGNDGNGNERQRQRRWRRLPRRRRPGRWRRERSRRRRRLTTRQSSVIASNVAIV